MHEFSRSVPRFYYVQPLVYPASLRMTPEEIEAMMRGAQPQEGEIVRDFIASYASECECGAAIVEGEKAGYISADSRASCWDCCDEALSA